MSKSNHFKFIKTSTVVLVVLISVLAQNNKFVLLLNISKFLNIMTMNAAELAREIEVVLNEPNYKTRLYEIYMDDLSVEMEKVDSVIKLLNAEDYNRTDKSYTMFKQTKSYYDELINIHECPKEVRHERIARFLDSLEVIREVMDLTRKHGTRNPLEKVEPVEFL
uniref:Uncharacterized protein n=1 Tax=Clastoptera arizonana TaxID=38151 RepID=A0A1B6DVZ0_9HEMI